jgi:hypothetical protein
MNSRGSICCRSSKAPGYDIALLRLPPYLLPRRLFIVSAVHLGRASCVAAFMVGLQTDIRSQQFRISS